VARVGSEGERAFTLIELVTVITILGVLVAMAIPQYKVAILQSREAVLREDLYRFREAIDQYQADKGHYPASLEALSTDGYLRSIPNDPLSGAADWKEIPADPDPDNPQDNPGIQDVKSNAQGNSLGGTPYTEW
jgi:general secretion pathway protein G